jgi:hypothetical protein
MLPGQIQSPPATRRRRAGRRPGGDAKAGAGQGGGEAAVATIQSNADADEDEERQVEAERHEDGAPGARPA